MVSNKEKELSKKDKIELELKRQGFLYNYWRDAEKTNLTIIGFFASVILIPFIVNATLDLKDWSNLVMVFLIIVLIVVFIKRDKYYNTKQSDSRKIMEKLKI